MFQGNVNVTCIILPIIYIDSRHEYKSRKFYNVKRNCRDMYCGLWHCAMTEKTICCAELHNLSALYPYIISEHEIEC